MLLEIPVSGWISGNFLVPRLSSWLQINSDTWAMLAGVRAVSTRSGGLRFENLMSPFFYLANQWTTVPSSVRNLLNFNNLKRIKSLIALQNSDLQNSLQKATSRHGTWWRLGWLVYFQLKGRWYPCCSRERLWVVEDLKGRYRNARNEWWYVLRCVHPSEILLTILLK